jgi:hypothetical protein
MNKNCNLIHIAFGRAQIIVIIFIISLASCKKTDSNSTNSNVSFTGNYYGYIYKGWDCLPSHNCHSLNNDTVVIYKGNTAGELNMYSRETGGINYIYYGSQTGDSLTFEAQSDTGSLFAIAFFHGDSLIVQSKTGSTQPVYGYFAGVKQQ